MQLLKRVEEYRVSTEQEAVELVDNFKESQAGGGYEVVKSGYTLKTKKEKKQIVDSWYVVSITMNFNLE